MVMNQMLTKANQLMLTTNYNQLKREKLTSYIPSQFLWKNNNSIHIEKHPVRQFPFSSSPSKLQLYWLICLFRFFFSSSFIHFSCCLLVFLLFLFFLKRKQQSMVQDLKTKISARRSFILSREHPEEETANRCCFPLMFVLFLSLLLCVAPISITQASSYSSLVSVRLCSLVYACVFI